MNPETLARFFFLKKSLLLRLLFLTPFSFSTSTQKKARAFKVTFNATRLLFLLFKTTTYTRRARR